MSISGNGEGRMTAARWVSLIIGCLCIFGSLTPKNPDIYDVVCKVSYLVSASALVIVPLVLEFLERRKDEDSQLGG